MSQQKRCANASSEQKELLAEFVKTHAKLISGKFSSTFTVKDAQKLWQEAAEILNAVPGGGHKTWLQWRKTWQDLQSRTKRKGAEIKKIRRKTGGGTIDEVPSFKPEEEAVLDVLSKASTEGHEVAETNINFTFEDSTVIDFPEMLNFETENSPPHPKNDTQQSSEERFAGNSTKNVRKERKSRARELKETLSHANYLGDIQKAYLSDKKKFNEEVVAIKKRKVEALERSAAAQERLAAAIEVIAVAFSQRDNN